MKPTSVINGKLYKLKPGGEINNKHILNNQRLIITHLSLEGLDDMYEYSKNPIFYRSMNIQPHKSKKDTEYYLKELIRRTKHGYAGGKAMYWFIRLKSSRKVIGTFGFASLNENNKSVQIAKGLSADYWGKGYVYELLGIMLSYAFSVLELNYIYSMTNKTNIANIKSMEKGGFRIVELIDNYTDNIGKTNDAVKMTVRKEEAMPEECFDRAFQKYRNL